MAVTSTSGLAHAAPCSYPLRDGSLREACARRGVPTLVFEGGEANRFNDAAINETLARSGVLVIPERVVTFSGDSAWVTVRTPAGADERRVIRTGLSDAITIEVVNGLAEGERVRVRVVYHSPTVVPLVGRLIKDVELRWKCAAKLLPGDGSTPEPVQLPDGSRKRGQVLDTAKDLVAIQIFEGTNQVQRLIISRSLLKDGLPV